MMPDETAKAVPLSECLLGLKGYTIDDILVTETPAGLHVRIVSSKPGELEPENVCAITYRNTSFIIPDIKKFVDWLIINEDLNNAWWFEDFIIRMHEEFQTVNK